MQFSAKAILENLRDSDLDSSLPFRPKGGELFKFKMEGLKAQGWRADGHRWINQGTAALSRKILKWRRVVTVFPELFCSLSACCHILAVKKTLGLEIKQKATPNSTGLHTVDKKRKVGRKRPRPGNFDYVLEAIDVEKSVMNVDVTEDSSPAITDKFVTNCRKRKPVTKKDVTAHFVMDNYIIRKPMMTENTSVSGPD